MDERLNTKTLKALLKQLGSLEFETQGKDFLLTFDKSDEDIRAIATIAEILKELHRRRRPLRIFDTGLAVSIFRDKSTRTRLSFASAAAALGLELTDLDEEKSQITHGETVRETAQMISFLTEAIGIRDDMYLGEGNAYMREVATAVDEGFDKGVLHHRPTIVNLQCDIDHPTQTMADLLKLKNHFGSFEALKGKKLAMTWAYSPSYGKPLSVPQGIIGLMTRFGMNVALAHPKGYDLLPQVMKLAKKNSAIHGGSFTSVSSMEDAFADADVVYPKSWAPFKVMKRRTELLKARDVKGLGDLEKHCLEQNAQYQSWECDRAKMKATTQGKALYMHCLPADISGVSCKNGEVSKEVFEQYRLETYDQAGYKPFVIAAMIFASKIRNVKEALEQLMNSKRRTLLY